MSKQDDDFVSDAWGAELEGKEAVVPGANREALMKALQLNPNLRESGSAEDILQMLERASAAQKIGGAEEAKRVPPRDLVEAVNQYKTRYIEDKRKLKEEIAKLQRTERELGPKTLERIIDAILDIDPNMTALPTQEMVKTEMPFLNEVGFTAKKLNERKITRKK